MTAPSTTRGGRTTAARSRSPSPRTGPRCLALDDARRRGDEAAIARRSRALATARPPGSGQLPLPSLRPLTPRDAPYFFDWLEHPELRRLLARDRDRRGLLADRRARRCTSAAGTTSSSRAPSRTSPGSAGRDGGGARRPEARRRAVAPRALGAARAARRGRGADRRRTTGSCASSTRSSRGARPASSTRPSPCTSWATAGATSTAGRRRDRGRVDWYLHSGGRANSAYGDGLAVAGAARRRAARRLRLRPAGPVASAGGHSCCDETLAPMGPAAPGAPSAGATCSSTRRRRSSATSTSIGDVRVTLYAASTAVDTDFTAKLCLVDRGRRVGRTSSRGSSAPASATRARRRRRSSPGEVYEYRDRPGPARRPHPGRLAAAARRVELRLPALGPQPQHRRAARREGPEAVVVARQTVLHDRARPSPRVTLPGARAPAGTAVDLQGSGGSAAGVGRFEGVSGRARRVPAVPASGGQRRPRRPRRRRRNIRPRAR